MQCVCRAYVFFFFNDTATTEIYTLSLHDALPISTSLRIRAPPQRFVERRRRAIEVARLQTTLDASGVRLDGEADPDRKSTRLNSSHSQISYAVFCLKKKPTPNPRTSPSRSRPAPR